MAKKFVNINATIQGNVESRTEMVGNVGYEIYPLIMVVEGVMNGILYESEPLIESTEFWNGRPVTINHPMDADGNFESANQTKFLDTAQVGTVFNTFTDFNDNLCRLRAEAWLEPTRMINQGHTAVLETLRSGEEIPLEVSTGLFLDQVMQPGEFNGVEYSSIGINYRPDHLALLPNEEGACSIADGCGVRANKKLNVTTSISSGQNACQCGGACQTEDVKMNETEMKSFFNKFLDWFKSNQELESNELSDREIREQISGAVQDKHGSMDKYVWTDMIYFGSKTFIIESDGKHYRGSFDIDNDVITIGDSLEEVVSETIWKPANAGLNQSASETEVSTMSDTQNTDAKPEVNEAELADYLANKESFEAYKKAEASKLEALRRSVLDINAAYTVDIVGNMPVEALEAIVKANEAAKPVEGAPEGNAEESAENKGKSKKHETKDDGSEDDKMEDNSDAESAANSNEDAANSNEELDANFQGKGGGPASKANGKVESVDIIGNRELFQEIWATK